jgi:tRNA threonylcarbamoyl adenosine modification protein (Sua5/YciO/YrdC/YwlC family)
VLNAIEDAADALRRGELVVFPTDTLYGLAARPDDPAAGARIFDAKRRPRDLSLPILVPSVEAAHAVARFDDRADRVASAFWPGALTLILPRTEASRAWELGMDADSIGVRVPRHPLALALLEITGPMAVTSANLSGQPPARTCDELRAAFGDQVAVYLCRDDEGKGVASAVLDLAHGDARLLRPGALDADEIVRLLGPGVPLLDSPPSA